MHKILIFLTVCFAISLAVARQDKFKKKDLLDLNYEPSPKGRKLTKFCSNQTIAQNYLTEILSVIEVFQSNSSYESILQSQSTHLIAYVKNVANQELLRKDCEGFLKGLVEAKKADKSIQRTRKYLASTIRKQIKQVARHVNNGKRFDEFRS